MYVEIGCVSHFLTDTVCPYVVVASLGRFLTLQPFNFYVFVRSPPLTPQSRETGGWLPQIKQKPVYVNLSLKLVAPGISKGGKSCSGFT